MKTFDTGELGGHFFSGVIILLYICTYMCTYMPFYNYV